MSSWRGAEIGKLIDEELAPYRVGDQVLFDGPEVQLQPATAQTLTLALHELVTNSAKYGALSTLAGRLSIFWKVQADHLVLEWTEMDGPQIQKPISRGFAREA